MLRNAKDALINVDPISVKIFRGFWYSGDNLVKLNTAVSVHEGRLHYFANKRSLRYFINDAFRAPLLFLSPAEYY